MSLHSSTVKSLVEPDISSIFQPEEENRRWSKGPQLCSDRRLMDLIYGPESVQSQLWDKPLLRIWDENSGSQPDADGCMLARAPRLPLRTRDVRIQTLKRHANHRDWEPTPYISFTSSATGLESIARMRAQRRGQVVTVIDPQIRFKRGLPVLHFIDEMRFYRILNPYRQDYYTNHYLCLWEVTPEEVVGTWAWDDLCQDPEWYGKTILSALQARRLALDSIDLKIHSEPGSSGHCSAHFESEESDDEAETCFPSDSEDSYERVCEENYAGELLKMFEDRL